MADLRNSVIVNMTGNVARQSRLFGRAVGRFSRSSRLQLRAMQRVGAGAGRVLDRAGNRFTALASGAAVAGSARGVVRLERRFTRLGIQAEISGDKVQKLKRDIFDAAQAPNIRIDPSELTSAIEEVVTKTGDLDLARQNLDLMARAISATGSAGRDIGALIADLQQKFGLKSKDEFLKALDLLARQGKDGSFELNNLATQGERVSAAFAATGRTGPIAVREMGAILQMAKRSVGSAEEAATSFERLLSAITAEKIGDLQKQGIQVFDQAALSKGVKQFRAIPDIIKDIIRVSGGDSQKLSTIFDIRALRALNAFSIEFKQTGGFESFDKFLNVQADGKTIIADSARAAQDSAGAFQNLSTAWQSFADTNLAGPVQSVADALNSVDKDQFDAIAKGVIGLGLAALILPKAFRAIGAVTRFAAGRGLGGRGRGGRGGRGGLGGGGGPVPVFVTNLGGLGGGGGSGRRRRGRAGRLGRAGALLGGAGRFAGRAVAPVAVGLAAFDAVSALTDDKLSRRQKGGAVGGALGSAGGALAGAKVGALLGTAVLPGVGTAAGAVGGGLIGMLFGDAVGRKLGELVTGQASRFAGAGRAGAGPEGRIVIELQNAPPGTRVRDLASEGVQLDVETGISLASGA